MMLTAPLRALALGLVLTLSASKAAPQPAPGRITVERVKVHAASLEGNLEGNAVDRTLIVYLPPSYAADKRRRYPVVYALHGYSIDNEKWTAEARTPASIEAAFAAGAKEMIVVLPNGISRHNGSMYSNSVTTGNFEGYIARDVVAHVDKTYRTIPRRESRGLMGHSMGGYGALRIGMKHPEVFSSLYSMSPCCLSPRGLPNQTQQLQALETLTPAQVASGGWGVRTVFASAAAWSPNPKNPPFYLDLPTKDGVVRPSVAARWAANAPLVMVHQYIPALRSYRAIAIDVGDRDGLRNEAEQMHQTLLTYGIANRFEIYEGDHVNRVGERVEKHAIPFFAANLAFEQPRK